MPNLFTLLLTRVAMFASWMVALVTALNLVACSSSAPQNPSEATSPQGQPTAVTPNHTPANMPTNMKERCDHIRLKLRETAIHDLGIDPMKTVLTKVSSCVAPEAAPKVAQFSASEGTVGVKNGGEEDIIADTYEKAIFDCKLRGGPLARILDGKMVIGTSAGHYHYTDGWVYVVYTQPIPRPENEGELKAVYLATNADQTRYKPFFSYVKAQTPEAENSEANTDLSLSGYVDLQMPAGCGKYESKIDVLEFDTLKGPGLPSPATNPEEKKE